MATFKEVQDRIQNEYLNRTTFAEETKTAIRAAIRHYKNQRWTFNETAVALATSAGAIAVAFPSNYLLLDKLQVTSNGINYPLKRANLGTIQAMNADSIQQCPTHFALHQNQIQLAPIPDAIYPILIDYIKEFDELSADDSTNSFIGGVMQDVICFHAAKLVWGMSIRNDKEAAKFASLEQMALMTLETHLINTYSGIIEPSGYF